MAVTMIERIARLLCAREGGDPDEVRHGELHAAGRTWLGWQAHASEARGLLAAMREPTEAMAQVGGNEIPRESECLAEDAADIWRAMIDEELAEVPIRTEPTS